jgi:hypothetical protein
MDSETALTTPTTAFVTDWTRLACRLSPAIQSIRRPARLTVITFRFISDHDDLYLLQLQALNEGISQRSNRNVTLREQVLNQLKVVLAIDIQALLGTDVVSDGTPGEDARSTADVIRREHVN